MSRCGGARGEAGDPWRDDPYVVPFSGGVLRNRLGLRTHHALEEAETRLAAQREAELRAAGLPRPPFSLDTLRGIHRQLFQDVYGWAGEPRATTLSKAGDPAPFAPPRDIALRAARAFAAYAAAGDAATGPGSDRAAFVAAGARLLAEVNSVHPFREGNGRTQRLLLEAAGEHAGHPLDLRGTTKGRNAVASIDAHRGRDPSGLARLLDEATDPRRVAAVGRVLRAFREHGLANWNDLYVATTVAGQTYAGTMGGRAGDDFFLVVQDGPSGRGRWIAVGDARDAPPGVAVGERTAFKAARFFAPGAAAPISGPHTDRRGEGDPSVARRDWHNDLASLGLRPADDIRAAVVRLAREHGVTGARERLDDFVDAAQRLADVEVEPDAVERLLVGLGREEVVTDEQRFALHAAYLDQLAAERGAGAPAAGSPAGTPADAAAADGV